MNKLLMIIAITSLVSCSVRKNDIRYSDTLKHAKSEVKKINNNQLSKLDPSKIFPTQSLKGHITSELIYLNTEKTNNKIKHFFKSKNSINRVVFHYKSSSRQYEYQGFTFLGW